MFDKNELEQRISGKLPQYIIMENKESVFIPKYMRERMAKEISLVVIEYLKENKNKEGRSMANSKKKPTAKKKASKSKTSTPKAN